MAKEYIGPIYNPTAVINNQDVTSAIKFYPNPSSGIYSVTGLPLKSKLTIFNVMEEKVFSDEPNEAF